MGLSDGPQFLVERTACRNFASGLVQAIEDKHSRIKDGFHSDCDSRFQRRDFDIAIDAMQRAVRRTDRCPLSVHDSFLVADIDREVLVQVIAAVLRPSCPPPPFLLGGTNP